MSNNKVNSCNHRHAFSRHNHTAHSTAIAYCTNERQKREIARETEYARDEYAAVVCHTLYNVYTLSFQFAPIYVVTMIRFTCDCITI